VESAFLGRNQAQRTKQGRSPGSGDTKCRGSRESPTSL
jgi:hypothetical protein